MQDFIAYPSRWRMALLTLGAAAFVAAGLWMAGAFGSLPSSRGHSAAAVAAIGWLCVIFFGFTGIMTVKKLFDTGEQLRIGPAGVRWASWSDQTIPWPEVINVTIWQHQKQKMIILHLRDPARFPGRVTLAILARANRMLTGGDICISLTGTDRSFDEAFSAIGQFRPWSAQTIQ